jgi:hypothetical protein
VRTASHLRPTLRGTGRDEGRALPSKGMSNDGPGFAGVLRASARSPQIGTLLRGFPRLRPEAVWKRGAPDAYGRKRKLDGFNLFLASGTDWKVVGGAVRRRLRALVPLVERGGELDVSFVLDVGVTPGERYRYRETRFPADDLARLAAFGIALCVTTNPPSVAEDLREARARRSPRRRGI